MASDQILSGKTAVVTGSSSGIGRAIAIRLGNAGARVFLSGRSAAGLEEAVAAVERAGGRATAVAADVRKPADVRALVERAVKDSGRLDVMVNNAGVEFPGTILDGDPERWRDMLETNILAVLVGAQAAVRAMRACKAEGHVVNISSVAGRREESGVYGSTKWAVNALATSLRKELENDSIRVTNIVPGAVATNFARNFPPEFVQGLVRSLGINAEFEPGGHAPPEVLEQIAKVGGQILASADDIARAVLFAVTQPIQLNVFEIVVRPQRQLAL